MTSPFPRICTLVSCQLSDFKTLPHPLPPSRPQLSPQQHPVTALCCSPTLLDRNIHGFQERKSTREGRGTGRELWALPRTCSQHDGYDSGIISGRSGVKAETKRQLPGNFFFYNALIKVIPSNSLQERDLNTCKPV